VELAAAFVLWPLVLDARRDFKWTELSVLLRRTSVSPARLNKPKDRRSGWVWPREHVFPLVLCALFVFVSVFLAAFPGEPHINLLTGHAWSSVHCKQSPLDLIDPRFDRLVLPRGNIVDAEKLDKFQKTTAKTREQLYYQGDRTPILQDRNLNCGDFSYADLRHIDWARSRLRNANLRNAKLAGASLVNVELEGASLDGADLQGASLESAQLQRASLDRAKLWGASLSRAKLQGASLNGAELQGANLDHAQLQGASLINAKFHGASLDGAGLEGVSLDFAQLQGASLNRATLWGASLSRAKLQGASLNGAELQGANLDHAQLDGASLDGAWLQGARLTTTSLAYTRFSDVYTWRARIIGLLDIPGERSKACCDFESFGQHQLV
jgi:uncharacterized protein YjbI with pentapeptide repeats